LCFFVSFNFLVNLHKELGHHIDCIGRFIAHSGNCILQLLVLLSDCFVHLLDRLGLVSLESVDSFHKVVAAHYHIDFFGPTLTVRGHGVRRFVMGLILATSFHVHGVGEDHGGVEGCLEVRSYTVEVRRQLLLF